MRLILSTLIYITLFSLKAQDITISKLEVDKLNNPITLKPIIKKVS